ncbi:MAG: TonB-dependent receptor [Erythrobacter sp.]
MAQDAETTETAPADNVIIVTATKRAQDLQDVPVAVSVLGEEALENLNIQGFGDYVQALPSVSFQSLGPGRNEVFFRGLSDGGNGNPSGTAPSAAIYLDEQPVTTIGGNLDIQIYDVSRIEALSGPQSTLFGASSQTGTLRIVTNAPDPDAIEAGFDVSASTTRFGDESYSVEGFFNLPLNDNIALRVVGWQIENGGYIDNVPATQTFSRNGQVVDNAEFVEEDFNTENKTGARAALGIDLDDNWTATLRATYQDQRTQGVFDHNPDEVGDLQVERFFNDSYRDEFLQLSGTIEGKIGGFDFSYSGSFLDRDTRYVNDYSEYAEYSALIDYYTCDYAYSYVSYAYNFSNCNDPRIQFEQTSKLKRQTHEARLLSDQTSRLRFLVGGFYDRQELDFLFAYRIPAIKPGFAISFSPGTPTDSYFVTDQRRIEEQLAFFGEVEFDLTDALTATFGYRYNETTVSLNGSVGTVFTADPNVDVRAEDTRSLFKGNLTYRVSDDFMTYVTFSQGFRPGGPNRVSTTNIPAIYAPDVVDNYELGWKSTLLGGRVRFNGAAFYMKWSDIQFTRFDPAESPLGLTNNAGDARAIGLEVDFAADVTDELTINGGFVLLDAELTESFTQDITATPGTPADAPEGTSLPFAPNFKATLSARYERPIGNLNGFVQVNGSYNGSTFNDLFIANRQRQASYALVNTSAGIERDNWRASVFVSNLTDERAELFRNATDFVSRITVNRPRTIGVSFGFDY